MRNIILIIINKMASKRGFSTLLEPEVLSISYERYGRAFSADDFQSYNQMTVEKLPVIKAYREMFSASHATVVQTDQTILLRLFSCITPPGFITNDGNPILANRSVEIVEIPLYFEMLNSHGEEFVQPMQLTGYEAEDTSFTARNPLYHKRNKGDTPRFDTPSIPFRYSIHEDDELTQEQFLSEEFASGLTQTYNLIAAIYAKQLNAQKGIIYINNDNTANITLTNCRIMYTIFTDRNQGKRGPIPNEQIVAGQGVPGIHIPLGFTFMTSQRQVLAIIGTPAQAL